MNPALLWDVQTRLRTALEARRGDWCCGSCLAATAQLPFRECLPAVDAFFRSAEQYGWGSGWDVRRVSCAICGLEKRSIRKRPKILA
jgi:hypothetical protein